LGRRRKKAPKIGLEHGHHAALFFYWNFKVSKNYKKIHVDVVNYVHYGHVKF
jgi:hypothetical protein